MRILFISPYAPTPIRTRPYHLLRALLRRGHQVTLATIYEAEEELKTLQVLSDLGAHLIQIPLNNWRRLINLAQALISGDPLQSRYSWSPDLFRAINDALILNPQTWDIIHFEHLRGACYGTALRKRLPNERPSAPLVWDSVDSISLLFEQAALSSKSTFGRWVTRFELPRTRRYERRMAKQFDQVLVTSSLDQAEFQRLAGASLPLTVLPNGVDLEYFTPGDWPRTLGEIVFTGKMSYHANITAALYLVQEIMPLVWKRQPDTRITLAGKDPPAQMRSLAAGDSRIHVTGTVADMRPYLRSAWLSVAPLPYGAGIQNKVLEAMACGTPVVANPQAVSALGAEPGTDLLVAGTPEGLAECILALLEDEAFSRRIGAAGHEYVVRRHDWNTVVAQLEQIYTMAIDRLESKHTL